MVEPRRFLTGEAFASIEEATAAMHEPDTTVTVDEGQRQMVLMALAALAAQRPGFLFALEAIALKMDNRNAEGKPDTFTRLKSYQEAR